MNASDLTNQTDADFHNSVDFIPVIDSLSFTACDLFHGEIIFEPDCNAVKLSTKISNLLTSKMFNEFKTDTKLTNCFFCYNRPNVHKSIYALVW